MIHKKLTDFKITAFYPYVPFSKGGMEVGTEWKGILPWLDVKVPGSIYNYLQEAGYIEDPYYEMNSLKCEWVSQRWWVYICDFDLNTDENHNYTIFFEGIDYKAHFYLNGNKLGEHVGMFTPAEFDISKVCKNGNNTLKVIFEHAPDEMGQIGYTSKSSTQKARFNYKWDFCTRLIEIGLYRPVYIKKYGKAKISELSTYLKNMEGDVALSVAVEALCDYHLKWELSYDGKIVKDGNYSNNQSALAKLDFILDNIKLWYPNGRGNQNLYSLSIQLFSAGILSDEKQINVGFKTLKTIKNEGADDNALNYVFEINGEKIYIKGVNFVPLDMKYGTVTYERYKQHLILLKEINVNLIRVWGGGLIESEDFYNLCDEMGFMVWQDFIQSSSGIDNYPSEEQNFLSLLSKTAEQACKEKRNHVSLTAFCGGNELMYPSWKPVGFENNNVDMLYKIVEKHCSHIPFFPTTSSGNHFAPVFTQDYKNNHDVHGDWMFSGVENHYTFYNDLYCLFHGEYGVNGLANHNALCKMLSKNNLYPADMDDNIVWRHKGEMWNSYKRDSSVFGDFDNLEDYCIASQFIQSEGLRYAVEADRRRAFVNSGGMIWQSGEPYPNVSCTSVIDYYNQPKMAYYSLKKAYQKVNPSLKYKKLVYEKNEQICADLFLSSEDKGIFTLKYYIYFDDKLANEKFFNNILLQKDKALFIETIKIQPSYEHSSVHVYLEVFDDKGVKYDNNILLLIKKEKGICELNCVKRLFERLKA